MKILILEYRVGNIYSLKCGLERIGITPEISPEIGKSVDGIILPGVGNFTVACQSLEKHRLNLEELRKADIPILGICLGMQLMFESSEEGPGQGLGFFAGRVVRFPPVGKVPHMGWNTLRIVSNHEIVDGISDGAWAYFVHSYYASPRDRSVVAAVSEYGVEFPAVVAERNLAGTQFHPEKSSTAGERILRNFIAMCRR